MNDQTKWAVWFVALLFVAVPVWIVFQAILSIFKTRHEIAKDGVWDGSIFRYYTPPLVSMSAFNPLKDADRAAEVTFEDAAPNSLVRWETTVEGPKNRIAANIAPAGYGNVLKNIGLPRPKGGSSGGVRLDATKKAWLIVEAESPDTDIAIVRVYMRSWEP